jgi:hypothetical protein
VSRPGVLHREEAEALKIGSRETLETIRMLTGELDRSRAAAKRTMTELAELCATRSLSAGDTKKVFAKLRSDAAWRENAETARQLRQDIVVLRAARKHMRLARYERRSLIEHEEMGARAYDQWKLEQERAGRKVEEFALEVPRVDVAPLNVLLKPLLQQHDSVRKKDWHLDDDTIQLVIGSTSATDLIYAKMALQ